MAQNDILLVDSIIDKINSQYPNGLDQSETFELFCFEQILKDADLSFEELKDGWTDGTNDGGIDGFFIFLDGHPLDEDYLSVAAHRGPKLQIHIFTCKRSSSFEQPPLNSLHASLVELFDLRKSNDELTYPFSQVLLDKRDLFREVFIGLADRRPDVEVNFYYACRGDTATLSDNLLSRAAQIKSLIQSQFSSVEASFTFVGAGELLQLARQQKTYALKLRFIETYISREGKNYVLLAALPNYFDFITDEHGKLRRYLFDSNVRDFLGFNLVNKDILATLNRQSPPTTEDFWWLNNGVTILATHATVVGKEISIENVQIVNGLQTTETVYEYFSGGGKKSDKRAILLKILLATDEEARARIVKATNYQNGVEVGSIRGLDKIQIDIEQLFLDHGLYYDRRRNFYKNQGRAVEKIVSMPYVSAAVRSIALGAPASSARARSRSLRNDDIYNQIFGQKWDLRVFLACVQITRSIEEVLQEDSVRDVPLALAHNVGYVYACLKMGKIDYKPNEIAALVNSAPSREQVLQLLEELRSATKEFPSPAKKKRLRGILLQKNFLDWFVAGHSNPFQSE